MSMYQLFFDFWLMLFDGAPTTATDNWVPLFAMLSVAAVVFGIFLCVAKIFK